MYRTQTLLFTLHRKAVSYLLHLSAYIQVVDLAACRTPKVMKHLHLAGLGTGQYHWNHVATA
jgi:hypothetical protein